MTRISAELSVYVPVCLSTVSAGHAEADVRVLGPQPRLTSHHLTSQENPGQDGGIPRHQNLTLQPPAYPALCPTMPHLLPQPDRERERERKNSINVSQC